MFNPLQYDRERSFLLSHFNLPCPSMSGRVSGAIAVSWKDLGVPLLFALSTIFFITPALESGTPGASRIVEGTFPPPPESRSEVVESCKCQLDLLRV